jgi:hypothetical protein
MLYVSDGFGSPLIESKEITGSTATTFFSEWPHFRHSNDRCSNPSGPSETAVVIILFAHLGQRGRAMMGNSSLSYFPACGIASALKWCLCQAMQHIVPPANCRSGLENNSKGMAVPSREPAGNGSAFESPPRGCCLKKPPAA